MDTRCTPAVLGHRADETTNLGINPRSTRIARTGDPGPVSAEPISIPPGDRVGVHDNEPARAPRIKELKRENARLQRRLAWVETMLETQKKASELLGIPLNPIDDDEND